MVLDFSLHEFELEWLKYRHSCYAQIPKGSGYRTEGEWIFHGFRNGLR